MGLRRNTHNARTRLWTRGSQTVVAFVHAARKRRRGLIIATLVLLVVLAVVGVGMLRYFKAEAAAAVMNGYGSLSQCLLGKPADATQSASVRFRAIQLTALTQSDLTRNAKDAAPWPDRCARFAHILKEGVGGSAISDTEDGKALQAAAGALAAELEKKENHFADMSVVVDDLFAAAAKAGIEAAEASDVLAPPAPATALTLDGLKGVFTESAINLGSIATPPTTGAVVHIAATDKAGKKGPFWCAITPGKATCASIGKPAIDAGKLTLQGTADDGAAPLLFGKNAVYAAADGSVQSDSAADGGHIAADGIVDLVRSDGRLTFWSRIEKGRERKSPIFMAGMQVANATRDQRLFGDHFIAMVNKGDDRLLVGARLEGTRMSRPAEIGPLPDGFTPLESDVISGCRAGRNDVVRFAGSDASHLIFWLGSSWSAPVKAMAGRALLGCHGATATLSRHRNGSSGQLSSTIDVDTCDNKSCKRTSMDMRQLLVGEVTLAPAGEMEVVPVGDATAVAWLAEQRGGLRLRVAPANDLANTPDVIAYDNLVVDGKITTISTLADVRAIAGDGFAVLLLGTTQGLRALTVDAKGRVEPVDVTWK